MSRESVSTERWICDYCGRKVLNPDLEKWKVLGTLGDLCPTCWDGVRLTVQSIIPLCGALKVDAASLVEAVVIAGGLSE